MAVVDAPSVEDADATAHNAVVGLRAECVIKDPLPPIPIPSGPQSSSSSGGVVGEVHMAGTGSRDS